MTEPQFTKEFEQLKDFRDTFIKLTEQPETLGDFGYVKQKLLYDAERLWPKIEEHCKQFGIPLERDDIEEAERRDVLIGVQMIHDPNLPQPEYRPPPKELITLDLVKNVIDALEKSGKQPMTLHDFPSLRSKYESLYIPRSDKIKEIITKVLVRLEPQASYKKPTGTEEEYGLDEIDEKIIKEIKSNLAKIIKSKGKDHFVKVIDNWSKPFLECKEIGGLDYLDCDPYENESGMINVEKILPNRLLCYIFERGFQPTELIKDVLIAAVYAHLKMGEIYPADSIKKEKEKITFDVLVASIDDYWPENIYYFLDITGGQEESGEKGKNTDNIAIDDKELTIIAELAEGLDKTFLQVEIEAATSIKRGTLKDKLQRLESIGLIDRPLGRRKGYQITNKGRDVANRNQ